MSIKKENPNHYAADWNTYSAQWCDRFSETHTHLGDEWGTERCAIGRFDRFARPWLRSDTVALEIGAGGGKYTVRLAPAVERLVVCDVSEAMIARAAQRCRDAGLGNVQFHVVDGSSLGPVDTDGVDLIFSYDVFVHIAPPDNLSYIAEFARVLRPGGRVVVHYAVDGASQSRDRQQWTLGWERGGQPTPGQYFYHDAQGLMRLYERMGFDIEEFTLQGETGVLTARKPEIDLVSRLEQILGRLRDARGSSAAERAALADEVRELAGELPRALDRALASYVEAEDREARCVAAAAVRRVWRGAV